MLLLLVNLKQVSPRMGKPMSTPFWLTHLSVGVNKMDPTELSYSKKRYEKIVKESAPTLRKLAATLTLEHLCQFLVGMLTCLLYTSDAADDRYVV